MNGTAAVIPVPSNAPYATTVSLGAADVVANTAFTTTITSTLPSGVPLLSVSRRRATTAVGNQATILEYLQLTPTADIAGTGGYTVNATIPSSYVQAGAHFWAQACLTPDDSTSCAIWYGPFGPGTVTTSGTASSLSVTIPFDALAGTRTHTFALYQISDSVNQNPTQTANTAWTTSGRQILLNGAPFFVRGVAYSPNYNNTCCLGSPLGASQQSTWQQDLTMWQNMGVNAVHVYNVSPTTTSNLAPFLQAANAGKPVYAMLESYFAVPASPTACPNFPAMSCYSTAELNMYRVRYQHLATNWGTYPDVMGFIMGTEWNGVGASNISPDMWKQLSKISHATRQALAAVGAKKILVSALVDDGLPNTLPTVAGGEANKYDIDVWGYDVYRGPNYSGCSPPLSIGTNGCLWTQVLASTTKPFLLTEYGTPDAYHANPGSSNQPNASVLPNPAPSTTPYACANLPMNDTPDMRDAVTYYACVQTGMETQSAVTNSANVASGGFIFEWNDEFWKAGCGTLAFQCGGLNGNSLQGGAPLSTVSNSGSLYNDASFYGITTGSAPRTVRQTYCWFQQHWVGAYQSPCPAY